MMASPSFLADYRCHVGILKEILAAQRMGPQVIVCRGTVDQASGSCASSGVPVSRRLTPQSRFLLPRTGL